VVDPFRHAKTIQQRIQQTALLALGNDMSWSVGRRKDIIIRISSTDAVNWQGARMNAVLDARKRGEVNTARQATHIISLNFSHGEDCQSMDAA
jgi:hypothetical protein